MNTMLTLIDGFPLPTKPLMDITSAVLQAAGTRDGTALCYEVQSGPWAECPAPIVQHPGRFGLRREHEDGSATTVSFKTEAERDLFLAAVAVHEERNQ